MLPGLGYRPATWKARRPPVGLPAAAPVLGPFFPRSSRSGPSVVSVPGSRRHPGAPTSERGFHAAHLLWPAWRPRVDPARAREPVEALPGRAQRAGSQQFCLSFHSTTFPTKAGVSRVLGPHPLLNSWRPHRVCTYPCAYTHVHAFKVNAVEIPTCSAGPPLETTDSVLWPCPQSGRALGLGDQSRLAQGLTLHWRPPPIL